MRRLAALILCAVAFGAACSDTSSAPAATVNGVKIPTKDLVDELNAIGANSDYLSSQESTYASAGAAVTGSTPGSYDAAYVSQVLLQEINYTLLHTEFKKRNLKVSDACKLRAKDELQMQLGTGDQGAQVLAKFPKQYQDLLLQRNIEFLAVATDTAGEVCGNEADTYFASHPDDFASFCISLIAVADEPTADSIVAQARAGADFAALAQQFSIDPSTKANGGDAGCVVVGQLNDMVRTALEAAQVGDVLDPIPGQSGVSILKLTGKQPPGQLDDQTRSQANELATLAAQNEFGNWLQQARSQANVSVDPRYGTFDPSTFGINPPTIDLNSSSPSPTPPTTASSSSSSEG